MATRGRERVTSACPSSCARAFQCLSIMYQLLMQAGRQRMDKPPELAIFPYSWVVGQKAMRQALEIAYVSPSVGGVLIRGQRGTAKSTTARAFAQMISGDLPVT